MAAPAPQHFCVRWNSYHVNLQTVFPKLLSCEYFVDVTLACDNTLIKCHKVVLSACSSLFENILLQNPCQHPTIIIKDMKIKELQSLVDFMYKGEVNVTQDELPNILKAAEALKIRGLSGTADQYLNDTNAENNLNLNNTSVQTERSVIMPATATVAPPTPLVKLVAAPSAEDARLPPPPTNILQTELTRNREVTRAGKADGEGSSMNETHSDVKVEKPDDDDDNPLVIDTCTVGAKTLTSKCDNDDENARTICRGEEHIKEEITYGDDLDMDYLDDDGASETATEPTGGELQSATFNDAIARVRCMYQMNTNTTNQTNSSDYICTKRIRRSEAELSQAADCITAGQTFQNVSDKFNIPISTIRFFMARRGILPRRKRGRGACNNSGNSSNDFNEHDSRSESPSGPPFHLVNYRLPEIEPAFKL